MPKKHTSTYQTTKPQSPAHPSLRSTLKSPSSTAGPPQSVNSLLHHLRHSQSSQSSRPTDPRTALVAAKPPSSSSSSATPPPPLRLGAGAGPGPRAPRRPPRPRLAGPPPPASWLEAQRLYADWDPPGPGLEASRHAPSRARARKPEASQWERPNPPPLLPDLPLPRPDSLQATALRAMAREWGWFVQAPQGEWVAGNLTGRMKSALVGYLAGIQGGGEGDVVRRGELEALFGPVYSEDEGGWVAGGEGVSHLVIGPSVGFEGGVSWKELGRLLDRKVGGFEGGEGKGKGTGEVPERWDQEEEPELEAESEEVQEREEGEDGNSTVGRRLDLPFLPSLTHLSLARCPGTSGWRALLSPSVLPYLANLTHLDLSYWPIPTLTPNAMTAKVEGPAGLVEYGGTSFYVGIDGDWKESVSVMKRLGKGCRSLVWLGLEGCTGWLPALGYEGGSESRGMRSRHWREERVSNDEEGAEDTKIRAIDWNGAWRGLRSVKVSQGYVPKVYRGPPDDFSIHSPAGRKSLDSYEMHGTYRWLMIESENRALEAKVAKWRLDAGLGPVQFQKTEAQSWVELEILQYGKDSKIEWSRYM
ncbi:hypothetical protein MMC10_001099 [Thelotrema lepadinum]|nr:hypothetical protein [Thelotrema lepadinum]